MDSNLRRSQRKSAAKLVVNTSSNIPVMHTRSRTRKQALEEKAVDQEMSDSSSIENVQPVEVPKPARKSLTRRSQTTPSPLKPSQIQLFPLVERLPASPEKKEYEEDVFEKPAKQKDTSVQVSLCKNCKSGWRRINMTPVFIAICLTALTMKMKDLIDLLPVTEYAMVIDSLSMPASLNLDELLDNAINVTRSASNTIMNYVKV